MITHMQVLTMANNNLAAASKILTENGLKRLPQAKSFKIDHSRPDESGGCEDFLASMTQRRHLSMEVTESMRRDIAARQALYDELYGAAMTETRARSRQLKHQMRCAEKRQAWAEVKRIKAQVCWLNVSELLCALGSSGNLQSSKVYA
jgi:hypothetical protein